MKAIRNMEPAWEQERGRKFALTQLRVDIPSSGYRSYNLNRAVGGDKASNHLMGCAADVRCIGLEQAVRYAAILLDKMDEAHADFDEIIIERNLNIYWLHFAVRQSGNRRKVTMIVKR